MPRSGNFGHFNMRRVGGACLQGLRKSSERGRFRFQLADDVQQRHPNVRGPGDRVVAVAGAVLVNVTAWSDQCGRAAGLRISHRHQLASLALINQPLSSLVVLSELWTLLAVQEVVEAEM